MSEITLTEGQQTALGAFIQFLVDPNEPVFVICGYSGTGKTTLVRELLDQLPDLTRAARLINPNLPHYEVELTATTNKAAENFGHITGQHVSTIHSALGLRVHTDYKTGETRLEPTKNAGLDRKLLFIDEASYIDSALLKQIFQLARQCKIVFMGDPAQLTPVKSSTTPVFEAKFPTAMLSEVMRQAAGNPIVDLSTKFRETVNSGEFFSFTPDGHHIQYLDRSAFEDAILAEFTRPEWRYKDSKILAWTNKCVIAYNHAIRDKISGDPSHKVGDYAICNKYVQAGKYGVKTDQMVLITGISEDREEYGVVGNTFTLDGMHKIFGPKSREAQKALIKASREAGVYHIADEAENRWIDLRAAYAQTINKSQGSTYDRVFIDLDDIRRCNSGNMLARMLYVAVSRARHQVFLTGDIC